MDQVSEQKGEKTPDQFCSSQLPRRTVLQSDEQFFKVRISDLYNRPQIFIPSNRCLFAWICSTVTQLFVWDSDGCRPVQEIKRGPGVLGRGLRDKKRGDQRDQRVFFSMVLDGNKAIYSTFNQNEKPAQKVANSFKTPFGESETQVVET